MTQTVGSVRTDYLKKNPDIIKAIIEGRRKGVEYLVKHPDEAGAILARQYKMDPKITKTAINDNLAAKGTYWSTGQFDHEGIDGLLKGLVLLTAAEAGRSEGPGGGKRGVVRVNDGGGRTSKKKQKKKNNK